MSSNLHRILDNEDFLKSLTVLTKKAKCKLTVCPEEENLDDQWMQVRGPCPPEVEGQRQALGFLGWSGRTDSQKPLHQGAQSGSSSNIDWEPPRPHPHFHAHPLTRTLCLCPSLLKCLPSYHQSCSSEASMKAAPPCMPPFQKDHIPLPVH